MWYTGVNARVEKNTLERQKKMWKNVGVSISTMVCIWGINPSPTPPQKHHSPLFHQPPLLNLRTTFFYCFLSKNFNPPWKMSPALCSNPLLKFGTFQAPQPFENLVVGSTPRLLLMNWVRLTILRNWRLKEWSYYYWIKETVETLLHCSNHE